MWIRTYKSRNYRTGNLMVIIKLSLMISVIVIIKINANIKINS